MLSRCCRIMLLVLFICWLLIYSNNLQRSLAYNHSRPQEVEDFVRFSEKLQPQILMPISVEEIAKRIRAINLDETVYNGRIFKPFEDDDLIILIQVHNRINYLKLLISSLKKVQGISQVLIVFSHDFYDENINELISKIHFCKYMQIFYPYSNQLFPNSYPGISSKDCLLAMEENQTLKLTCMDKLSTDSYGNTRNASLVQVKLHWWWKANKIFNGMKTTRNHTGLVLFLEDDYYLIQDSVYVLKNMVEFARANSNSSLFCLGLHSEIRLRSILGNVNTVDLTDKLNYKPLAFNKTIWSRIVACANEFCTYDDYNWDWTMEHIGFHCLGAELTMIVLENPRVFHAGICGVHQSKVCGTRHEILYVRRIIDMYKEDSILFRKNFTWDSNNGLRKYRMTANGGWADRRDHELCLWMTIR